MASAPIDASAIPLHDIGLEDCRCAGTHACPSGYARAKRSR